MNIEKGVMEVRMGVWNGENKNDLYKIIFKKTYQVRQN